MKTRLPLLVSVLLTAILSVRVLAVEIAPIGIVKAVWKQGFYSNPRYRRDECWHAEAAINDILSAAGARNIRTKCYWSQGVDASWEALEPARTGAAWVWISRLLPAAENARGGDWLSGLGEQWRSSAEAAENSAAVDAVWRRSQLQRSMSGNLGCNAYAEVVDQLLDRLAVRNVATQVFCNAGSGAIYTAFDHLAVVGDTAR